MSSSKPAGCTFELTATERFSYAAAPRPTQSGVVCRRRRTGHDHSAASSSGRSVVPCHWPPDQRRRATRCGETSEWCVTATPESVDEGRIWPEESRDGVGVDARQLALLAEYGGGTSL